MQAQRKGPLRLERADLSPSQRVIVLAMRQEARRPTVRVSFTRLGLLVVAAFLAGLVAGCEQRPTTLTECQAGCAAKGLAFRDMYCTVGSSLGCTCRCNSPL